MPLLAQRLCAPCKEDFLLHLAQGTEEDGNRDRWLLRKRALAKMVDVYFAFLLFAPLGGLVASFGDNSLLYTIAGAVSLVLYGTAAIYMTARFGGTIGKLVMHLEVVGSDGHWIDRKTSLLRFFVEHGGALLLGLSYLVSMTNRDGKALQDFACGTSVVGKTP